MMFLGAFTTTAALIASMAGPVVADASAGQAREFSFAVAHFYDPLVRGRIDPIVTPNKISPHVHIAHGGGNFGIGSKGDDMLNSNCTTSKITGDNSAYWAPILYFKDPKTGLLEAVDLFYMNVYYFFSKTTDKIVAFPPGLNLVSGDVKLRTPPAKSALNLDASAGPIQPVSVSCPRMSYDTPSWPVDSDGSMAGIPFAANGPQGLGQDGVGFPVENCDGTYSPMRLNVYFPSCYDRSKALDDHEHNMQWPEVDPLTGTETCKEGFDHFPKLFFETYWNTANFSDRWTPDGKTQPFILSNGDATGYSSHGDFQSGWDVDTLQHIIDTCNTGTVGMEHCPGVELNPDQQCKATPVDPSEELDGPMSKLPGNNPLSGWQYGQADSEEASSSDDASVDADSESSSPKAGGDSSTAAVAGSNQATSSSAPTATQRATVQVDSTGSTAAVISEAPSPNVAVVWETVTVSVTQTDDCDEPATTGNVKARGHKHLGHHRHGHHSHH